VVGGHAPSPENFGSVTHSPEKAQTSTYFAVIACQLYELSNSVQLQLIGGQLQAFLWEAFWGTSWNKETGIVVKCVRHSYTMLIT